MQLNYVMDTKLENIRRIIFNREYIFTLLSKRKCQHHYETAPKPHKSYKYVYNYFF